jgi:4a-hydroxytetrahydrobiopterin dehydratase
MMVKSKVKLSSSEIAKSLKTLSGWVVDTHGAIHREFIFSDFPRAFGFMASVATIAQALNHHPNWSNVYNKVSVRLKTHDADGLTHLDMELAKHMSRLAQGAEKNK